MDALAVRRVRVALAAAAVLLLVAGGAAWYVLGQRDAIDSPDLSAGTDPLLVAVTDDASEPDDEGGSGTTLPDPETDTLPNTFYVSPTVGNEANDGQTAAAPWSDLQASLDRLKPGETLYLMDGVYAGELVEPPAMFVVRNSGEPDRWIEVAAARGHEPIIQPTEGNGLVVKANYIMVSGLTVRGDGFGPDNAYGWGLLVRNSHHVSFVGNTVSDMPVGGISSVESSNLDIIGNTVYDNSFWGTEQGSGISLWHSRDWGQEAGPDGYHDRIIGNVAYRNENKVFSRWHPDEEKITDGNGIIIDESRDFEYTGRFLVANNVVFDNGGRGILVTKAAHVDIVFNTSYLNGRTAELFSPPTEIAVTTASDVRVLNNLAVSRPGVPDLRVFDITEVESAGNIFITDSPSGFATDLDLVTIDGAGLVAPSTDPVAADFRPAHGSVLIGAGVDYGVRLPTDFDGVRRETTRVDVGAFSYRADD